MDETYRTEADTLEAFWISNGCKHIEIKQARDTSTGELVRFAPGTDLADARDQTCRRWTALWDRVGNAMWAAWATSGPRPSNPHSTK